MTADREAEKEQERSQFIEWLQSLSKLEEPERCRRLMERWHDLGISSGLLLESALRHAYGRVNGAQIFWRHRLSNPLRTDTFVRLLAVGVMFPSKFDDRQQALRDALQIALQKDEPWFIVDATTRASQAGERRLDGKMEVKPREAVHWLLLHFESHSDFVPESLRRVLGDDDEGTEGGKNAAEKCLDKVRKRLGRLCVRNETPGG